MRARFSDVWVVAAACATVPSAGVQPVNGWTEFTPSSDTRLIYVSKAASPVVAWESGRTYSAGTVVLYPVAQQGVNGPYVARAFWRASGTPAAGVAPGTGVAGWTETRDPGVVYRWNGSQVVDSAGNTYGSDPLNPQGITSFYSYGTTSASVSAWGSLRSGYADWCLFRRGEIWTAGVDQFTPFRFVEGRGADERTVHAAWGPLTDDRPLFVWRPGGITDQYGNAPGNFCNGYATDPHRGNLAFVSMVSVPQDMNAAERGSGPSIVGAWDGQTMLDNVLYEDLRVDGTGYGFMFQWLGDGFNFKVTVRRCVVSNVWLVGAHNQGCYVSSIEALTMEDCIFDRNGYKGNPRTDDTLRDIFSRNFYLSTYNQMGVTIRNLISCNGGSGGPQMRCGGLIERSLVLNEGYWFTGTGSNGYYPPWSFAQQGVSGIVRDNVMIKWRATGTTDDRSHPGWGFIVQDGAFGVQVHDNIITGRHMVLNGQDNGDQYAFQLAGSEDAQRPTTRDCIRDNICYLAGPINLSTSSGLANDTVRGNVVVHDGRALSVNGSSNTALSGNRYYTGGASPFRTDDGDQTYAQYVAEGVTRDDGSSTVSPFAGAVAAEGWPAPDRSVRSYMDSLGYTVTTADGVREFMEEAYQQRKGHWRPEFTGVAVVDYVREGFGRQRLIGVKPGTGGRSAGPRVPGIRCANPYRAGSPIVCDVPRGSAVRVAIHDLRGGLVRVLYQGSGGDRALRLSWDGASDAGRISAAATYVVSVSWPGARQSATITLAR